MAEQLGYIRLAHIPNVFVDKQSGISAGDQRESLMRDAAVRLSQRNGS